MRLLIYGINFSPELTGIGKYSGEMAGWLQRHGHEVVVVTGIPYYPQWRVQDGYFSWKYSVEKIDGVKVIRCPMWVPKSPSGVKRLVHLASFAVSSFPVLISKLNWRADLIWVVVPAFFCVPGALIFSRLARARSWLHVQDYEIDAAFDLGLLKGDRLKKVTIAIEKWLLRKFDRFSTISGRMLALAHSKGVSRESSVLFPNWVDISGFSNSVATQEGNSFRKELGIPSAAVVALYSGNMGAKQGLEILAGAAALLSGRPDIYFVFCGNGAGRANLEVLVGDAENVRFLDLQPVERLAELLGMADIHLLPQRADAADLVMPSKLTGMLASGRAVVATAHVGTEVAEVVESCGVVVPPENAKLFSEAIVRLADNSDWRASLGMAGRLYAERKLDRESVLRDFDLELKRLCLN